MANNFPLPWRCLGYHFFLESHEKSRDNHKMEGWSSMSLYGYFLIIGCYSNLGVFIGVTPFFSGPTAAWSYKQIDPNSGQSSENPNRLRNFGCSDNPTSCWIVRRSLEISDWTLTIVRHVFILGPSHRVYFTQCATPVVDCYETPLGNLKLDDQIIQKLQVLNHWKLFM